MSNAFAKVHASSLVLVGIVGVLCGASGLLFLVAEIQRDEDFHLVSGVVGALVPLASVGSLVALQIESRRKQLRFPRGAAIILGLLCAITSPVLLITGMIWGQLRESGGGWLLAAAAACLGVAVMILVVAAVSW